MKPFNPSSYTPDTVITIQVLRDLGFEERQYSKSKKRFVFDAATIEAKSEDDFETDPGIRFFFKEQGHDNGFSFIVTLQNLLNRIEDLVL